MAGRSGLDKTFPLILIILMCFLYQSHCRQKLILSLPCLYHGNGENMAPTKGMKSKTGLGNNPASMKQVYTVHSFESQTP